MKLDIKLQYVHTLRSSVSTTSAAACVDEVAYARSTHLCSSGCGAGIELPQVRLREVVPYLGVPAAADHQHALPFQLHPGSGFTPAETAAWPSEQLPHLRASSAAHQQAHEDAFFTVGAEKNCPIAPIDSHFLLV